MGSKVGIGEWENFGVHEIEEELESYDDQMVYYGNGDPLQSIREEIENGSVYSRDEDTVYVVIWAKHADETSSMDALRWTLNISDSTLVYLLHIFPEVKYIPTPLGNMHINQVNPGQKDIYMAQERRKRRDFLQKFLNLSSFSKVKVDTILIESEMEAKAILDLIPILNIKKLVIGATKSTLRRIRSKKGNGVADQIVQSAPDYCEINIICDGKQMSIGLEEDSLPSPSPSPKGPLDPTPTAFPNPTIGCGCFRI